MDHENTDFFVSTVHFLSICIMFLYVILSKDPQRNNFFIYLSSTGTLSLLHPEHVIDTAVGKRESLLNFFFL